MLIVVRFNKGIETFLMAMAYWWLLIASIKMCKVKLRCNTKRGIIWDEV